MSYSSINPLKVGQLIPQTPVSDPTPFKWFVYQSPTASASTTGRLFDKVRWALYTMLQHGQRAFDSVRRRLGVIAAASVRPDDTGGMAERLKAVVLKTTVAVMSPGVRIPLPPPGAASYNKSR